MTKIPSAYIQEAFFEWIKVNKDKNNELETPLIYYKERLRIKLRSLISMCSEQLDIERAASQYIKGIGKIVDLYHEEAAQYVELFYNMIESKARTEEKQMYVLHVEKAAFVFAGKCACNMMGQSHAAAQGFWLQSYEDMKKWCNSNDDVLFTELWNQLEESAAPEQQTEIGKIKDKVYEFVLWLEDNTENIINQKENDITGFVENLYGSMCKAWSEESRGYNTYLVKSASGKRQDIMDYRFWTLAGRYLGIDRRTKDSEQRWKHIFAAICAQFVKTECDAVVEKYREITADIFMYSVMQLSPFAYLNLVTTVIPEVDLNIRFNIERIITVLYVMEAERDENDKPSLEGYRKVCRGLFRQLQTYYCNLLGRNCDAVVLAVFENIDCGWEQETAEKKYVDIKPLRDCLRRTKEKPGKNSEEIHILSHIEKLCGLLEWIIFDGYYYVLELDDQKHKLEDYLRGVDELKRVHDMMKSGEDAGMKKLAELCELSTKYLETQHYETGIVKDSKLNGKSIEFLLGLYYDHKIRNARKQ